MGASQAVMAMLLLHMRTLLCWRGIQAGPAAVDRCFLQMFVMLCPIPSMLGSGHNGFHTGFPRVSLAYLWSHL